MKRKQLTETLMMISDYAKRALVSMVYTKYISVLRVKDSPLPLCTVSDFDTKVVI